MSDIADIFDSMQYGPAPEAAEFVHAWLKARQQPAGHFISGTWHGAGDENAQSITSHNPSDGTVLAHLSSAGAQDVDRAVQAAHEAGPAWRALSDYQRAKYLYALARLIQKNSRFLAVLDTLDNGKPIRETRDIDIPLAARHFYYHAGWAQLRTREFAGHDPLGVVAQIIPWNFPFLMLSWKIAPALAAGNTVVLKPAEYTSLSGLYFAQLCMEAGLPDGVVNIITGDGQTGALLVDHPQVAKVAFTGSTEVGRLIRARTAGSGKALSLELGGKSPFVVFEDADLDAAVEGLVDAIFFNQGEVCCAGSRLLVQESIEAALTEKLKARLGSFRIGDPLDKTVDMGALADPVQQQRITTLVNQAVSEGATLWHAPVPCPAQGCYYPPTLLSNVAPANIAMREEIFGPVLSMMSFRTPDEALSLANNTRYGLAASIWSENLSRALALAQGVKAGVVWINCTNQFDAGVGFGGYRESGYGREGGREGMYEYLARRGTWLRDKQDKAQYQHEPQLAMVAPESQTGPAVQALDKTPKHYIGGKQARPDGGTTLAVSNAAGKLAGRIALGNRKDIRNAVEAAFKAAAWSASTAHTRAQILYFLAENLDYRADEFAREIKTLCGVSLSKARREVSASISRLFSYAALADKHEGRVQEPPARAYVIAAREPVGILAAVCPDQLPLLGLVSLLAPAMAAGNRSVIVPSARYGLLAALFYQVLETSDVPAGVVNLVTGERDVLSATLAEHDQVDTMWYFGHARGARQVETAACANMKRTWVNHGRALDWWSQQHGEGRHFLRACTQVKNIWMPHGD